MKDQKATTGDVAACLILILLISSPILIGLWLSTPDYYPTINVAHIHSCTEDE